MLKSDFEFQKNMLVTGDGLQIEYYVMFGQGRRWTLTASKHGVSMSDSPVLESRLQLDNFARALSEAFRDFKSIKFTGKPFDHSPPPPEPIIDEPFPPEASNEVPQ